MPNSQTRAAAVVATGTRESRNVEWPSTGDRPAYVSEIFGSHVLTLSALAEALPKPVYKQFLAHFSGSEVYLLIY
jgi:hypothetical protein